MIAVDELSVALGDGPHGLAPCTLHVARGEVVLLQGPSGCGKSTLLRVLAGLIPQFHGGRVGGRVRVDGVDTLTARPGVMARHAALAFQDPEAQAVMAGVARDVAFGPESLGHAARDIPGTVRDALRATGAEHLAGRAIATLSSGERQRAALAAVLAQRTPVLLLDEPTSQLDARASAALLTAVRELADRDGVTVVMSSHDPDPPARLADRVVRLGDPEPAAPAPAVRTPRGAVAAALVDVTVTRGGRRVLGAASLGVARGEVVALTGSNGSGKTSLLRVLAGLDAPEAGRVMLGGADVTGEPAERRVPRIALVPQDPGRHLLTATVAAELQVGPRALRVPVAERTARMRLALTRMGLEGFDHRHPLDLSTGERERVAVAAALTIRPGVLLLDEPTRGMDPAARDRLAALLRRHAAGGGAVIVATHDPNLVRAACDRRVDIHDGVLRDMPAVPG